MDKNELDDIARELYKVKDVLDAASEYFIHQSEMNAQLHMSNTVRLTPLGAAIENARDDVGALIGSIEEKSLSDD